MRADLLGRVMALAAHADGRLTLHASAVSVAGRAVAFVGPKHAGKSTLALALVRKGARLLTDDTLVVRLQSRRQRGPRRAFSACASGRTPRARSVLLVSGRGRAKPTATARA